MRKHKPHVVVIGGGFGGLHAAQALAGKVRLTLIDKHNYHLFHPLLYQVAAGELSPSDVAFPLRALWMCDPQVAVVQGEVTAIDWDQHTVQIQSGAIWTYDYLIIAGGSQPFFHNHPEWAPHVFPLYGLSDALAIQKKWLSLWEAADQQAVTAPGAQLLPIRCVIIGGGPTGVELAGALAECAHQMIQAGLFRLSAQQVEITLMEAGDRLLPAFSPASSFYTASVLRSWGVQVLCNTRVDALDAQQIRVSTGVWYPAELIIWATGMVPVGIAQLIQGTVACDPQGRLEVGPDLCIPDHPDVFAIGDVSASQDTTGALWPDLAAVATQQGCFVASRIMRQAAGRPMPRRFQRFDYRNWGQLAIIGRYAGIAEGKRWRITGRLGWAIWHIVHLYFLPGIRNRLRVGLKWIGLYIRRDNPERLVIDENR